MSQGSSKTPPDKRDHPIVGRDPEIDLEKYLVRVHGRDIIDYEQLRRDNPTLYQTLLNREYAEDHRDAINKQTNSLDLI
jgi:hypothetical protein